jgi:hypothetical protein
MNSTTLNAATARQKRINRFGPQALADAEVRHTLYLEVRSHVLAGWDRLPSGLSGRDLRELAVMAKARGDRRMYALCSCAESDPLTRPVEAAA